MKDEEWTVWRFDAPSPDRLLTVHSAIRFAIGRQRTGPVLFNTMDVGTCWCVEGAMTLCGWCKQTVWCQAQRHSMQAPVPMVLLCAICASRVAVC